MGHGCLIFVSQPAALGQFVLVIKREGEVHCFVEDVQKRLCTLHSVKEYVYKACDRHNHFALVTIITVGTAVAQWLSCCATNRKVAGSIPAGVIGIIH